MPFGVGKSGGARPGGGGRWQDQYEFGPAPGLTGREATCVWIGMQWLAILETMADSLRAIDVDPLVEPKHLAGAIILTLDQTLPAELTLTPEIVAVGGSTALLFQRWTHARRIKEHKEKSAYAARFNASRPINPEPAPAEPSPAPPASSPPEAGDPAPATALQVVPSVHVEHVEPERPRWTASQLAGLG